MGGRLSALNFRGFRPGGNGGGRNGTPARNGAANGHPNGNGGPQQRRRIGPFWIEEGLGVLAAGGAILAVFAVLFILAVVFRPM